MSKFNNSVTPAKAGVQVSNMTFKSRFTTWIPAFAGMTILTLSGCSKKEIEQAAKEADNPATRYVDGLRTSVGNAEDVTRRTQERAAQVEEQYKEAQKYQ